MARSCRCLYLTLLLVLAQVPGCHRSFYRRQADREVYHLVAEKADNPRWPLAGYTINIDPMSRMYSPFSWDHPPMPMDDPYSHKLMHHVDGKKGYPFWHFNGDTSYAANPLWKSFLPLNEEGVLVLTADDSVRMALLQAPSYQRELEDLYLSALDVTFERFQFDAQFNAGYALDFLHQGRHRRGRNTGSRSVYTMTTNPAARGVAMRKMGVTGSTLVVGLANSLVWQFSGPDSYTARTLLDFSLVQPLLRQAGRDRILERLTLVERVLLANVRQMERFRRGFYVEVTTGQDAGDGPVRRGGVFGGTGLGAAFTGTGAGGFGALGNVTGVGGGGTGGANIGGYIGLLQDQQRIRNQETNVSQLRTALAQFEAFYEAERIDFLQVQQVRSDLYREQSVLLDLKTTYDTTLDTFKVQLGLPPSLKVEIKDDMIDTFNLIDDALDEPQDRLASLQSRVGLAVVSILNDVPQAAEGIEWSDELARRLTRLRGMVQDAEMVRQSIISDNIARARRDVESLNRNLDRRVETLERLRDKVEVTAEQGRSPQVEPTVLDSKRIKRLPGELTELLDGIEKQFANLKSPLAASISSLDDLLSHGGNRQPAEILTILRDKVFATVPGQIGDLSAFILELTLVQAQARTESVDLIAIEMKPAIAFQIAKNYRRDLMNARASLVDNWRLIEFNADNLESTLDIVFDGAITNVNDNPLDLRASAGSLRVGAQFDSPVNRLSERNTYRQTLIEYSQARRSFYTTVDQIDRSLRTILRNVELNQLNFEVRRQAVLIAIDEVLLARLRLQEPPKPDQPAGTSQQLGATTARDLVSALNNLRNAQNDFVNIWVTYETLRRSLDFNLGTMQLDQDGLWIDSGPITPDHGLPGDAAMYPGTFCPPAALFTTGDEASPIEELEPPLPGLPSDLNPQALPDPHAEFDDRVDDASDPPNQPLGEPPLPIVPDPEADIRPSRDAAPNPLRGPSDDAAPP